MWTFDQGLEMVRHLELVLAPLYHAVLGGGVLHRGSSKHDLDIVIIPHGSTRCDVSELRNLLRRAGLRQAVDRDHMLASWRARGLTDEKWVEVWMLEERRIDIILGATPPEVQEELTRLRAENARLKDMLGYDKET